MASHGSIEKAQEKRAEVTTTHLVGRNEQDNARFRHGIQLRRPRRTDRLQIAQDDARARVRTPCFAGRLFLRNARVAGPTSRALTRWLDVS